MSDLNLAKLIKDLQYLGIGEGDTVVVRASLKAIGRVRREIFLDALLQTVGPNGNIVSLAFTLPSFIKKANPGLIFQRNSISYAGALPNEMLGREGAVRSKHPICSFVAIGPLASWLMEGHGPQSRPYDPIKKVIQLRGKMLLIGCVESSPGFTTAHLAEYDVGLQKRIIMPWLSSIWYFNEDGRRRLFRPRDSGLCSMSFSKFYKFHVEHGFLYSGHVGNAYSIWVPAEQAYGVERAILERSPRFNVCGNPDCFTCNMQRWDRLHRIPIWLIRNSRRIMNRLFSRWVRR
ncbi:MAG: AAC(3) family N-acetyltransferase [Pseudomonadota bacterium]